MRTSCFWLSNLVSCLQAEPCLFNRGSARMVPTLPHATASLPKMPQTPRAKICRMGPKSCRGIAIQYGVLWTFGTTATLLFCLGECSKVGLPLGSLVAISRPSEMHTCARQSQNYAYLRCKASAVWSLGIFVAPGTNATKIAVMAIFGNNTQYPIP